LGLGGSRGGGGVSSLQCAACWPSGMVMCMLVCGLVVTNHSLSSIIHCRIYKTTHRHKQTASTLLFAHGLHSGCCLLLCLCLHIQCPSPWVLFLPGNLQCQCGICKCTFWLYVCYSSRLCLCYMQDVAHGLCLCPCCIIYNLPDTKENHEARIKKKNGLLSWLLWLLWLLCLCSHSSLVSLAASTLAFAFFFEYLFERLVTFLVGAFVAPRRGFVDVEAWSHNNAHSAHNWQH
jgi:hypothetical protein